MAKGTVNIKFQTDIAELEKAKKHLEGLLNMQREVESDPLKLGFDDNLLKELVKEIKIAERSIEQFGDIGAKSQEKIADSAKKATEEVKKLANEGKRSTDFSKGQEKATDLLAKSEDRRLSVLNRTRRALGQSFLEAPMYSASFALMSTVGEAIKYYVEFDKVLTRIAIVGERSTESMQVFAKYANAAGLALGVTGKAFAEATSIFIQQGGLAADNAASLADATIKIANITGDTADKVSDYITAIANSFKLLETDGVAAGKRIADVLAKLDAISGSSANEIAEAFKRAASSFAAAGFEMEEAAAILSVVSETTRQTARMVGTGFKTLIGNINEVRSGSEQYVQITNKLDALTRRFGISFSLLDEFTGDMKATPVILQEIADMYNTLTSRAAKNALIEAVAGKEQRDRFIALMENQDRYKELLDEARNSANAANEAQALYMESLDGKLKQISNRWEEFNQAIIDRDAFKYILDQLSAVMGLVNDLLRSGSGVTALITRLGSTMGPLLARNLIGPDTMARMGSTAFGRGVQSFIPGAGGSMAGNLGARAREEFEFLSSKRSIGSITEEESGTLYELEQVATAAKAGSAMIGIATVAVTGAMTAISLAMNDELTTREKVTEGLATMAPAIGSLFGPLGTLAGAVIGMGITFFTADKELQSFRDQIRLATATAKESLVNEKARSRVEDLLATLETALPGSEEYILATNQLAELFPALSAGTDQFGNAILVSTDIMNDYISAMSDAVKIQEYKNILDREENKERFEALDKAQQEKVEKAEAAVLGQEGYKGLFSAIKEETGNDSILMIGVDYYRRGEIAKDAREAAKESLGDRADDASIFELAEEYQKNLKNQIEKLEKQESKTSFEEKTLRRLEKELKASEDAMLTVRMAEAERRGFEATRRSDTQQVILGLANVLSGRSGEEALELAGVKTGLSPITEDQQKNLAKFYSLAVPKIEDFYDKSTEEQLPLLLDMTEKFAEAQKNANDQIKDKLDLQKSDVEIMQEISEIVGRTATDPMQFYDGIEVSADPQEALKIIKEFREEQKKAFLGITEDLKTKENEYASLQETIQDLQYSLKASEEFGIELPDGEDIDSINNKINELKKTLVDLGVEIDDLAGGPLDKIIQQFGSAGFATALNISEEQIKNMASSMGDLSRVYGRLAEIREEYAAFQAWVDVHATKGLITDESMAILRSKTFNHLDIDFGEIEKMRQMMSEPTIPQSVKDEYAGRIMGTISAPEQAFKLSDWEALARVQKEFGEAQAEREKTNVKLLSQKIALERRYGETVSSAIVGGRAWTALTAQTIDQNKQQITANEKLIQQARESLSILPDTVEGKAQEVKLLREINSLLDQNNAFTRENTMLAFKQSTAPNVKALSEIERALKAVNHQLENSIQFSDKYLDATKKSLALEKSRAGALSNYIALTRVAIAQNEDNLEFFNILDGLLDRQMQAFNNIKRLTTESLTLPVKMNHLPIIEENEEGIRRINEEMEDYLKHSDEYLDLQSKTLGIQRDSFKSTELYIKGLTALAEANKDNIYFDMESVENEIKKATDDLGKLGSTIKKLEVDELLLGAKKEYTPFLAETDKRLRALNESLGYSTKFSDEYSEILSEIYEIEQDRYEETLKQIKAEEALLAANTNLTETQKEQIQNSLDALDVGRATQRAKTLQLETEILLTDIQKESMPILEENERRLKRLNERMSLSQTLSKEYLDLTEESLKIQKENYDILLKYISALAEEIKLRPDNIELLNEYNEALDMSGKLMQEINDLVKESAINAFNLALYGTANIDALQEQYDITLRLIDDIIDAHEQIIQKAQLELNIQKEIENSTNETYKSNLKYIQNKLKDVKLTKQIVDSTRAQLELLKALSGGSTGQMKLMRTGEGRFRFVSATETGAEDRASQLEAAARFEEDSISKYRTMSDEIFSVEQQIVQMLSRGEDTTNLEMLRDSLNEQRLAQQQEILKAKTISALVASGQGGLASQLTAGKISVEEAMSGLTPEQQAAIKESAQTELSGVLSSQSILIGSNYDLIASQDKLAEAFDKFRKEMNRSVGTATSSSGAPTVTPKSYQEQYIEAIGGALAPGESLKDRDVSSANQRKAWLAHVGATNERNALIKTLTDKLKDADDEEKERIKAEISSIQQQGKSSGNTLDNGILKTMSEQQFYSRFKNPRTVAGLKTGGYTGDFDGGKLAVLHEKELVLNKMDTENILKAVAMLRPGVNISGLNRQITPLSRTGTDGGQNVVINASFPGVSSSEEIQRAFKSMSTRALQYAYRTKSY